VSITERLAEVVGLTVPGHWEGVLILARGGRSTVAALDDHTTRFTLLVVPPTDRKAHSVRDAIVPKLIELPEQVRRTLTWGTGQRDWCACRLKGRERRRRVLLRPALTLAARHDREREPAASAIPAPQNQPRYRHHKPARSDRCPAERTSKRITRLAHTSREVQRAPSSDRLRPRYLPRSNESVHFFLISDSEVRADGGM
jgi:hypothetical protein